MRNIGQTGAQGPPLAHPSPHGEAALLLVESLIHGLLARSIISVRDAVDIVQSCLDVQNDLDDARASEPAPTRSAVQMLTEIAASLRIDDPDRA